MTIEIRQHQPGTKLTDFLSVPKRVLRDDPNYVSPLDMMIRDMLSPKSNPFFKHSEVALWTAHRAGVPVGRISAQVDGEHQRRYQDKVGFFGYFDCIDDIAVAEGLMASAQTWLRARNMQHMRGPLSLSVNEEIGMLVDGFDAPNVMFMGHHAPHQQRMAEATGLQKVKDLYAFHWKTGSLPRRAYAAHEQITELPEVRFREADFKREIEQLVAIQDDAWRHNWGHVSMTNAEAAQFAKDLALLIDPRIAIVAEIGGELAAMAIAAPNLNEAIRDLGGELSPIGVAKLIYRLKVQGLKSGRLVMLGIKEKFRKQKRYGALSLAMVAEMAKRGEAAGYEWAELGWTLEDNAPINLLIKVAGGRHYKTYRIFQKPL